MCSDKRKTKGRQREDKRNRIRQDPTTAALSSSPTDVERLDANVSSRDGLRKPPLPSSGHKCPPSESSRDKRKPCLNTGTTHWDRQIRPHSHDKHAPRATPRFQSTSFTRLMMSRPQQNHGKLDHQLVSKENKIVDVRKEDKDSVTITVKTNPL